jgi:Pentapeptide repeats (8 copies)
VLIILRVYLQIYVEHERRLDRIAQWIPTAQALTLTPDKNIILRSFRGFTFYLLLPLVMLAFWFKVAVFSRWGKAFFVVAIAVIAIHLTLPFRRLPWLSKVILSMAGAILAIAVITSFGNRLRRPFYLFRANLSDQWLVSVDLRGAELYYANLSRSQLLSWLAMVRARTLVMEKPSDFSM